MSENLLFWVGNLDPSITEQITNESNVPVDLTTAAVRFRMRKVGSSVLKVDQPASFKDVSGNVRYDWASADVDTAGEYLAWWTVTRGGKTQDMGEAMVVFAAHTPIVNGYLEPEQWKTSLEMQGQRYADQDIELAIDSASRVVEYLTGRRFWADQDALQVRYYSGDGHYQNVTRAGRYSEGFTGGGGDLWIDDLVQLTSLETAPSWDTATFTQTWTLNTDFRLAPYDAPAKGFPWRRIELVPGGTYQFPGWPHSVRVTGKFGWPAVPAGVVQATSLIATQIVRRVREAPFGIVGFGADGQVARINMTDPDLARLLGPYVRRRRMGMV